MNKQINLLLILILSCSEDDVIISNTPPNLPSQNYKIDLHSNSGSLLESVTIYWNNTEGEVELTDSNILITPSENSHTFSEMTRGEFRDITIQVITSDSIYVDSIQIFTWPVYPVYNFRYEVETVMRGNGVWDEGETYIDLANGIWDIGEDFIDCGTDENGNTICKNDEAWNETFGNGQWDEGEEFDDIENGQWDEGEEFDDIKYPKYHRVLNWSQTSEPDETFSNYIIYRADYDNIDMLINPENCECDIDTLTTKLDSSFTDSMVTEKSGEFEYFYQIRVNSISDGRNSYIYNYTNFTSPSKVSLVDANVSKNNNEFIQITWEPVSDSTYFYQYEIWRISDDNADDLRRIAIIVDPDQEKFMDRNVGSGTSYNYSVAVVAINGDRVFSDYVTGWSIP